MGVGRLWSAKQERVWYNFDMRKILRRVLCFGLAIVLSFSSVNFSYAENPCDKYPRSSEEYKRCWLELTGQNNILFYDPSGSGGGGCVFGNGDNNNYAGAKVFSDTELNAIEANRPFYEASAEKYNFPWQILAVLHRRENALLRKNPSNGQGAYQLYSYTRVPGTRELDSSKAFYPAGPISDAEFQRQTDIAADLVANVYASGIDLNTDSGVKRMFFNYNGTARVYLNQAISLGFSEEEAKNGEGSPYVMNRADEKRDPTIEPTRSNMTWGQIKGDNTRIEYPANSEFGAFIMYAALGGSSLYCNGDLVAGGMDLEQATIFMQDYIVEAQKYANVNTPITIESSGKKFTLSQNSCSGGTLANCVTFSKWFLNMYTEGINVSGPTGDGQYVVKNLISRGFTDGGTEPRPYAVFSRGGGSWGHTGVVLGIDIERNKIVIGEASCGKGLSGIGAHEYDLDDYKSGRYTYAYTDGYLRGI